jgi:hypothetical protein
MATIAPAPTTKPRIYIEKIGDREWELQEVELDVHSGVALWSDNPRLRTKMPAGDIRSEEELEATLQTTPGYDTLRKSIDDLGQMEPIYVQQLEAGDKVLVLEGATRVSILRELDRKHVTGIKEGRFRRVKAKMLPPDFGERERAILLARIHVRGSGVRSWGRYVEAKFVHDVVVGSNGPPLMNITQMAQYMEKSISWVQRLRDAFAFAQAYIDHIDDDGDAEKTAATQFSTLEEISKARVIGSMLREYDNANYDPLRGEVFDMVRNNAFKEYRDARFLKEFHDDPEKWEQLKSGEEHVASRLALEIKSNSSSVKAKIGSLAQQVRRSLDRDEGDLGEEEVAMLYQAATEIEGHVHPGVRPFRVQLRKFTGALSEASMADMKALDTDEVAEFREALEYFNQLFDKHGPKAA